MDRVTVEMDTTTDCTSIDLSKEVTKELDEIQLALVGGGFGDVTPI